MVSDVGCSGSGATTFDMARELLLSLLQCAPWTPAEHCPSLMLCGPPGGGKSHLVRTAVAEAQQRQQPNNSPPYPNIRVASASLALALTVRERDGSTGLRRLLRKSIRECCTTAADINVHGRAPRDAATSFVVLLVLDHTEFFIAAAADGSEVAHSSDLAASSGPAMRHPALVADFYTVLRGDPPLFTQAECVALHLRRLVIVSLFSLSAEQVNSFIRDVCVDLVVELPTPTEAERRRFFFEHATLPRCIPVSRDASSTHDLFVKLLIEELAARTGGIPYGGLVEIVSLLQSVTAGSADVVKPSSSQPGCAAAAAAGAVAQRVLRRFQSSTSVCAMQYRESIGYVDVQETRWGDIAGMQDVKDQLRRMVTQPLHLRDLYTAYAVRPSTGVLLHGPPGTGKTMLAKAMATELSASFVYLSLPELVQAEVGESERKLKELFAVARERSPTVMFMDELQAAFGVRYAHDTSAARPHGGTTHDARLVSHLLHLLDESQEDEAHFILFVGATNVIHLLDPLLLRAGRMDTVIEVPLPDRAARDGLARFVVFGEWSSWFMPSAAANMSSEKENLKDDVLDQHVAEVQEALVDAMVRLSDGFSGAALRSATSVMALQLARHLDEHVPSSTRTPTQMKRWFLRTLADVTDTSAADVSLSAAAEDMLAYAFSAGGHNSSA